MGVESLYVTTLPALINVIVRLSLSCKFNLGRCCDGGRVTIDWPAPVRRKKILRPPIFQERTDVEEGTSPAVPRGEKSHETSKNVRTLPDVETTRSDSLSFLPKDGTLGLDRFLALRVGTVLGTSVKPINPWDVPTDE